MRVFGSSTAVRPGFSVVRPATAKACCVRFPIKCLAFADDVPGMSDGNCISDATTRSIIAASGNGNGGASSGGSGGGSGGGKGDSSSSGDGDKPQAHPMRLWTFIFAGFLAAGGAAAFARKRSAASLGSSLGACFILLLCARSMVGVTAIGSVRVAFGITFLLGVAMASRFSQTKKVMPAGMVAGSSLLMSIGYLLSGL